MGNIQDSKDEDRVLDGGGNTVIPTVISFLFISKARLTGVIIGFIVDFSATIYIIIRS